MRFNDVASVQPDGPFCFLAVCPKCGAQQPAEVEVHGEARDCSAAALRSSAASAITCIGAGMLGLGVLYLTAGPAGVLVSLAIVGLCLAA